MFSSRRQSAIPGFRLQNYGFKNNPTVTIVTVGIKNIKRCGGERISFSAGQLLLLRNLLHQIIQAHGSALSPEHFSLLISFFYLFLG